MRFIDFFSGVGGFTRGMELAGHTCVGHCEIDKYAEASYRSMHTITEEQRQHLMTLPLKQRQKEILKEEYLNGEWYADNVTRVSPESVPEAECYCFGLHKSGVKFDLIDYRLYPAVSDESFKVMCLKIAHAYCLDPALLI